MEAFSLYFIYTVIKASKDKQESLQETWLGSVSEAATKENGSISSFLALFVSGINSL